MHIYLTKDETEMEESIYEYVAWPGRNAQQDKRRICTDSAVGCLAMRKELSKMVIQLTLPTAYGQQSSLLAVCTSKSLMEEMLVMLRKRELRNGYGERRIYTPRIFRSE